MGIADTFRSINDRDRPAVAPTLGVGGEPPPQSFITQCETARRGSWDLWQRYVERCTGAVPWNLPGRSAVPDIPLLEPALNIAAQLVPGVAPVAAALGVTGGPTVSNGWDPWIGMYGIGLGPCGPGMKCLGASVGGVCAGSCVPETQAAEPWVEIPVVGYEPYGPQILPEYQEPPTTYTPTGYPMANGVQICCPSGWHPNRSAYYTRGIRDGGGARWVPKGTKCVRNRRTNPLNPKALSRAGSRLYQGKQVNKWLSKVEIPKRRR